jgi:hypothetical protein
MKFPHLKIEDVLFEMSRVIETMRNNPSFRNHFRMTLLEDYLNELKERMK